MKKFLLILTSLIIFTIPNIIQADTKICKYIRTYKGDRNSSKNIEFSVTFTGVKDGSSCYPEVSLDNISGGVSDGETNYDIKLSDMTIQNQDIWHTLRGTGMIDCSGTEASITKCPELYYLESDNTITIFPLSHIPWHGNTQTKQLLPLNHADDEGNIITGDITNKSNSTKCYLQFSYYSARGKSGGLLEPDTTIRVDIDTYEDGSVYISYNGKGGYLSKVEGDGKAVALEIPMAQVNFSEENIQILNEDVDKIKSLYKYGEECPPTLIISRINNDYIIATEEKEDADHTTTASMNYTIDSDSTFFPNTQISPNESTCEELLGGTDSKIVKFIQNAWTIVKVASIIITIVLGIIEFISATSKDKDVLMEIVNKTIKRLILVIIILLLPTVVDIIGNILGTDNILCGIK